MVKLTKNMDDIELSNNKFFMDLQNSIQMTQGRYKSIKVSQETLDNIIDKGTAIMYANIVFNQEQNIINIMGHKVVIDDEVKQYELE